jgi:hypothetical protein
MVGRCESQSAYAAHILRTKKKETHEIVLSSRCFSLIGSILEPMMSICVGNRGDGNLRLHRADRAGARY